MVAKERQFVSIVCLSLYHQSLLPHVLFLHNILTGRCQLKLLQQGDQPTPHVVGVAQVEDFVDGRDGMTISRRMLL